MDWRQIIESAGLLFVLVNPFLLSIYLLEFIRRLDAATFRQVLVRGALIATVVFCLFGWTGDRMFTDILKLRFASFLLFGGVVFLLIALRFVFSGPESMADLRGETGQLASTIAMPFLIGPGTVSASVMIGARQEGVGAVLAIVVAMTASVASLLVFKAVHDWVSARREQLVERYVEIVGRLMALLIGSIAVEMILLGIENWLRLTSP